MIDNRHNGGPALDLDPPPPGSRCGDCKLWHPPSAQDQRNYLMRGNRPMQPPKGRCFDVAYKPTPSAVKCFSVRREEDMACFNYQPKPPHPGRTEPGGAFVTIWSPAGVEWQGSERDLPAKYRQTEFDL